MVRIVQAFEAIASTLPFGSVGYENQINERGERLIWLDHAVVSTHGSFFMWASCIGASCLAPPSCWRSARHASCVRWFCR